MNENNAANRLNEDAQEPTVAHGPTIVTNATEDSVAGASNQRQYEAAKQVVQ